MGDALAGIKILVIPAVISLILFLLLTFVVVPCWRRYRARYSQYLPIDAISEHTTSWRYRITNRIVRIASLPFRWRRDRDIAMAGGIPDRDLEEGEELEDIDEDIAQVLDALARSRRPDNERRLSRELEEGFIDDSSDSDSD
ncbi:hypothetical protein THAR02_09816 [Trichoderma harzianum]|uniref:Uncharacterized protein n=3 Tax=Trichoderma TaxID=5543 RepID=A0A2T4ALL6_TRIHA|nr:hypothetical protein M431DRAFT_505482 [Trichoderma harzianum CBS 226.95]KAK0759166.1 hypothetical protein N5P37_008655 [Trichoderma harzianum]KKO98072.1 hypothetical protein THAR02_09816 [Trichoderma harzianum]PTB57922.1 hypothetical protein M431DRAFT_505482 [Trichoderma harzianum CBS 226.95]QYS94776.1 hypothetical protein H0G86_002100 [Trichoderma simmonsii]